MIARLYQSQDAEALDKLLGVPQSGDVRLAYDRIAVLDSSRGPVGCLVWRPGGIVHELRVGNGLGQKRRADLLVQFGIRDAVSRAYCLHEAIFITDSERMANYAKELGAIEQTGKRVFSLEVRK